jgi:predicted HicB family RNase H-like nuclease
MKPIDELEPSVKMNVRVPRDVARAAEKLAHSRGITLADWIRVAVANQVVRELNPVKS